MPHLLSYLQLLFFGMLMWHLPSLPYIYSSLFTYLRHICNEKICANPFFASNAYFSWLWLSWKRGHDTSSCHQLHINSWTLENFLTCKGYHSSKSVWGSHHTAVERSCKFRHSSLQLAREPTNRSLMFLRSREKRM